MIKITMEQARELVESWYNKEGTYVSIFSQNKGIVGWLEVISWWDEMFELGYIFYLAEEKCIIAMSSERAAIMRSSDDLLPVWLRFSELPRFSKKDMTPAALESIFESFGRHTKATLEKLIEGATK